MEHDPHHEYGSHGSLTGFLPCFSVGICVLAVIILNLNTIVVKFIDIIIIIIIILFGLTRSELVRYLIGHPLQSCIIAGLGKEGKVGVHDRKDEAVIHHSGDHVLKEHDATEIWISHPANLIAGTETESSC